MTKLIRFDWAIKYLLRNKANFDILEGFLSELLKTPIHIEQILESESNKNHENDKFNRVDLLVKTAENKHIIIEVQCSNSWDYMSRILYGASKVVCEHLREGEPYRHIAKVISVSIVFFNLGEGKDYLYKGTTTFKGLHYHDILGLNAREQTAYGGQADTTTEQTPETVFPEYYLIRVTKFQERVQDKLDEWVYFLKHGEIKKEFAAQGIQSAKEKLDTLKLSESERRAYAHYREGLHDDASFADMLAISKREGRDEGRDEARREGEARELKNKQAIARKLYLKKMPLEEIAVITELSLEDLQKLLEH